jgi:hypothetical protein
LFIASCSQDDSDDEDEGPGFDCDRGYAIVLNASVQTQEQAQPFKYWLVEYQNDFVSGEVQDGTTGQIFTAVGQSPNENSFTLSHSPGTDYFGLTCETPLSLTLDLKYLLGSMKVYCGLDLLDSFEASAVIECDDTGVSL